MVAVSRGTVGRDGSGGGTEILRSLRSLGTTAPRTTSQSVYAPAKPSPAGIPMSFRPLFLLAALLLPAAAAAQASAADSTIEAITLERAVALATDRGLDAEAARQSLVAARQRDRAFDARFLPRLTLTGDAADVSRSFQPITLPTGETGFVRENRTRNFFQLGVEQPLPWTGGALTVGSRLTRVEQLRNDATVESWQTTPFIVGIRQSLFRPRAIVWDRREQDLQATAAERQFLEAREDIAGQTAVAYFDLYAAQVQVDNSTTNVAVNDTLYTLNTGRYEVGKIGENDLLQSELALLRARASLDQVRLQRARAGGALAVVLGVSPDALPAIAPPPDGPTFTADPERAVAEALRNRSLGLDLELQDVQASRRVREAQLNNRIGATVTATAGFNQTAPAFGNAYSSLLDQQRATVQVQMPLVQWRAGRADVEAARAERSRVEHSGRGQRATLEQDARFAALEIDQARRQLDLARLADSVAAKRFEIAKNRYVIGKIGIDNLFIAQSEKDAARQAMVQAQRGYWLAYHRLRRLTLYDFAEGKPIVE